MNIKSSKYQSGGMPWVIVAVIAFVVILVALTATVVIQHDGTEPELSPEDARAAALLSAHAPTSGDANAPVHIVEFLDPACETCALFYPVVKTWQREVPGKIRLSIRHVPFHNGAEYAVQVLEASREQGKYWETLEALLNTQAQWTQNHRVIPEQIRPALADVDLDWTVLEDDMDNFDIRMRMEQDQQDAVTLKVRATPQYFVNGRELYSFGYENLAALVRDELEAAARED
ncbi:MAG TPA: thioredoxin domain-containing protein [Woeseiaceae bacterium]|jgi:protein-disulfide isomerase|nr:thioredoxin domain-containing protein [Woeseiaceae bacterium]